MTLFLFLLQMSNNIVYIETAALNDDTQVMVNTSQVKLSGTVGKLNMSESSGGFKPGKPRTK